MTHPADDQRFAPSSLRAVPSSSAESLELVRRGKEKSLARLIERPSLPRHLAIIMDGNGRWANARGKSRLEGHRAGAKAVEKILNSVLEKGIPYLTLFAFSSENWRRPPIEVQGLMRLLEEYLVRNRKSFLDDGRVRLSVFGDKSRLPASLVTKLDDLERESHKTVSPSSSASNGTEEQANNGQANNGQAKNGKVFLHLGLALNYGGRDDIVRATRRLVARCLEGGQTAASLTEQHVAAALDTAAFPDPDLLIRTGGEQRISNFLLWQSAYTELMFTDCPWPDFDEKRLESMLADFAQRERRFGASNALTQAHAHNGAHEQA